MALMDTMTNVVGVLTIVLVMVAISLARSASRVISDLPPVTEEQLREAKEKLERLKAADAAPEKPKTKLTPAQLAALDDELFRLVRSRLGRNNLRFAIAVETHGYDC